jgi:hypothetical protein
MDGSHVVDGATATVATGGSAGEDDGGASSFLARCFGGLFGGRSQSVSFFACVLRDAYAGLLSRGWLGENEGSHEGSGALRGDRRVHLRA